MKNVIQKLKETKYHLKLKFLNTYVVPVFRKNRFLSNLYYVAFSNDFSREHQKVLNGKYLYIKALRDKKPNEFHLRREIHRIEKALIMKEQKPHFALDYIIDTVHHYRIICENYKNDLYSADKNLLIWAGSVLQRYFETVQEHEIVNRAKEVFVSVKGSFETYSDPVNLTPKFTPYKKCDAAKSNITFENFYQLATQRRSVRWYSDQPVPRDLIEKAVSAAALSPSACNRQPYQFRLFDETETKNMVGAIPMGIRGFYRNIPVFAVLMGKLSAYANERDRHVIYIDGGLAAMSFMLALETLGLSSLPINWPDIEFSEKQMERALNLGIDERPIMLIGIGYADPEGQIPFSQKKSTSLLTRYNLSTGITNDRIMNEKDKTSDIRVSNII